MSSVLLHQEDEHRGYIEGKRREEWGVGVDEGMIWVTWNETSSRSFCDSVYSESIRVIILWHMVGWVGERV